MKLGRTRQSQAIRDFLLDAVRSGKRHVVEDACGAFAVSRRSVRRHLDVLAERGFLEETGTGRERSWRLGRMRRQVGVYALDAITEDRVYAADFAFISEGLAENVRDIWQYGFTEMLNNAIDHSDGTEVEVFAVRNMESLFLRITDDGEGIFRRIARLLDLGDPREALLELSKGKLTTDPENHTGEGIFFSSRAFDVFAIQSGELLFTHLDEEPMDLLEQRPNGHPGSVVSMVLSTDSTQSLQAVFGAYTDPETLTFSKTLVPIRLALYEGGQLVSRSQAKRIMRRIDRFQHVMLDYQGVGSVGRSFVDEIYRVFANQHPEIEIASIHMLPAVEAEVRRVRGKSGGE